MRPQTQTKLGYTPGRMRAHEIITSALICARGTAGCTPARKPVAVPAAGSPVDATYSAVRQRPTDVAPKPQPIDWSAFDSVSVRNPNDGSLRGGVPLPLTAPGLRFNPGRDPAARYGTVEMVRGLVDAGSRVHRELGGLPVTINDLSREQGGPIPHHRSHQSGRDVDVLFYQLGPAGKPIESVGAFFDRTAEQAWTSGTWRTRPTTSACSSTSPGRGYSCKRSSKTTRRSFSSIFVAEHLRTLLLDYAQTHEVPSTTV